jgi:pyridoxamine 5'-phosphate oxidase family protein
MSHFSENEIAYMQSQKLGRLATLAEDGAPNVVPVGFTYNAELDVIEITGFKMGASKKFRNVQSDGRVSFVIDDVLPPWEPRGIEIRGNAVAFAVAGKEESEAAGSHWIRISPTHVISWGIDTHPYTRNSRKVGG